jgi:cytochrome P450
MLSPNLSKGQIRPSDAEITAEAVLMLEAGMGTTAHALCVATWSILSKALILRKLRNELDQATSNSRALNLENLEGEGFRYLRAVVKESLRFSYGAPGRLVREAPSQGLMLDGMFVPGGVSPALPATLGDVNEKIKTKIASSIYIHNHASPPFVDPFLFNPDRWMTDDPVQYAEMDRHMVSFSRGSRQCLGMK